MEGIRYLFKFYYIGKKRFFGSQRQKNGIGGLPTIESCLFKALKEKKYIEDQKKSGLELASRTDRFVSARGAAFSFVTEKRPYLIEINTALPEEIGIWAYAKIPRDFLSRFNAVYRHYKYIVSQPLSFLYNNYNLNFDIMEEACKELEGKHDFINFSKRGKEKVKTIRDMDSVKMKVVNNFLIFDFKSRAFLRQQIRRMISKILELGKGVINFDDFQKLFDPNNNLSYQPAEPSGLILWDINYGNDIKFKTELKSKKRMEAFFKNQEKKFEFKNQLFKILQQNDISK